MWKRKEMIQYTTEQLEAIDRAAKDRQLIITGGPGTGKSTITRAIVQQAHDRGAKVRLCSPTGKAAKRLAEASGYDATTIHRLLEYHPDLGGFQRNEENPIDADLIIVDEASMLDVKLAKALLSATADKTRLVLVGDKDQLPSVEAGALLRDLIASRKVPTVHLSQVMRQSERSAITTNAHLIIHGKLPEIDNDRLDDFKVYTYTDETPEEIAEHMCAMIQGPLAGLYHPIEGIQVIAPMRRGPLGTAGMNERLAAALNPRTEGNGHLVHKRGAAGEVTFQPGDKVIHTRNNYQLGVYNGEVGIVTHLSLHPFAFCVDYGDRTVSYPRDKISQVWPAWALTIHKSQGSEWPCVVMPVHTQHWIMIRRQLFYTAITRARSMVVIFTTEKALKKAVRDATEAKRRTALRWMLRGK